MADETYTLLPNTFMEPDTIFDRLGLKKWDEKEEEQIKMNRTMGMHPNEAVVRMTGRTTRMFVQALSVASAGIPVRIRAGSLGLEKRLSANLRHMASRAGISNRMIRSSTGIGVVEFYDHSFYQVFN